MAPILTFAMTAAITPGPNNIILSTNAVNFGFKKTIPLIFGVFFGFLSVLSLCLLGIGEIYKSFPTIALILKIIAASFLTYLSFKIFTSTSFSDEKSPKKFTFKDIYFFQIINPKAVTVSMSSSAIFIQNKFPYEIEFVLIFICFVISDLLYDFPKGVAPQSGIDKTINLLLLLFNNLKDVLSNSINSFLNST